GMLARHMESLANWPAAESEAVRRAQRLLANAQGRQGVFSSYLGQSEKSRLLLQNSLALLRQHGDPRDLAYFLIRSAHLAREAGDVAEARHMLLEAISVSQSVDSQTQVAQALRLLGYMEGDQGQFAEAIAHFEQALAIERSLNDTSNLAATLSS